MPLPVIAAIAVENTAYSFDKLFDYLIPDTMIESLSVGCRVLVDFGKGSKKRQGFVFSLSDTVPSDVKLKPVYRILDKEPLLNEEMIKLAQFIADRTFCTLFEAAKALLPSGICLNVIETYRLKKTDIPECTVNETENEIITYLAKKDAFVSEEKICKDLGLSEEAGYLEKLYKKGFLMKNTCFQYIIQ